MSAHGHTDTLTKVKAVCPPVSLHSLGRDNYDKMLANRMHAKMITMDIAFCKDISNSFSRFSLSFKWLASAAELAFGWSLPFTSISSVDQGRVSCSCKRSCALHTEVLTCTLTCKEIKLCQSVSKFSSSQQYLSHTHNRFTALWNLSGTTRVSRYQKKHSPTHTHCGHQQNLSVIIIITSVQSNLAKGRITATQPPLQSSRFSVHILSPLTSAKALIHHGHSAAYAVWIHSTILQYARYDNWIKIPI